MVRRRPRSERCFKTAPTPSQQVFSRIPRATSAESAVSLHSRRKTVLSAPKNDHSLLGGRSADRPTADA